MRKPGSTAAALVLVVLVVASAMVTVFVVFPARRGGSGTGSSQCDTCFIEEPAVDVIMPAIGTSGNYTNPNLTIKVSSGSSHDFEVDVYPTLAVNVTMAFRSYQVSPTASATAGTPSASFQPPGLSVRANEKGVTSMTLVVPAGAVKGTYGAVVSAVDNSNSSEVWGLLFFIQVS